MKNCNYTYMLRCADGSLYTGWTNDLKKRLEAHQSGKGGKYTRTHLPVELVYQETFPTKEEAMSREWKIKQLTKAEKEKLVREYRNAGEKYEPQSFDSVSYSLAMRTVR